MQPQRFTLHYDRHGEQDWCITTRTHTGLQRRLTHQVDLRVRVRTLIKRRGQPKALLVGVGTILWDRDHTEIR